MTNSIFETIKRCFGLDSSSMSAKTLEKFFHDRQFKLNGYGGLNIANTVVYEFNYLLKYLTGGELQDFDDLGLVAEKRGSIQATISAELAKPQTEEERFFGVSRATAESNLNKLSVIVRDIGDYIDLCNELQLPIQH